MPAAVQAQVTDPTLRDSFSIGDQGGSLCEVQATVRDSVIDGMFDRAWVVVHDVVHQRRDSVPEPLKRSLHKTIKKVSSDIEAFKFNTAISSLMILMNDWYEHGGGDKEFCSAFLRMLSPFAPHLSEELWALIGEQQSIALASWPAYDEALTKDDSVFIVIQVNGKVRDRIEVAADASEEDCLAAAHASEKVRAQLDGAEPRKVIVRPPKLVNFVV